MDDFKKVLLPAGYWGRKERKFLKFKARAKLKEQTRKTIKENERQRVIEDN